VSIATEQAAWTAAAAGLAEGIGGTTIDIDGQTWDADHRDDEGDPAPDGVLWLVRHDDGLQVTVRVHVELIEGTLT
jgi:hypothetical protein